MTHKIAIIFDFDITLSPYYQQRKIIEKWGIDEQEFWSQCTNMVTKTGYDLEHGYIRTLLDHIAQDEKHHLSNKDLFELGKGIDLYNGLSRKNGPSIFDDLIQIFEQEEYSELDIALECYCISGGLEEMIKGAFSEHKLDGYFKEIFACRMAEDDRGIIYFPKETVGHTIKTQKLFMISKGVLPSLGMPQDEVNRKVDEYDIPFENMIFIGDGMTDIPAFSLVNQMGGTSIAVYRESKNEDGTINHLKTLKDYEAGYKLAVEAQRAEQLLPADYSDGKPLKMALLYHVDRLCRQLLHK